jgi:hypothetical protein
MEYFPGEFTMVTGMIFYEAYTNKETICKEWNVLPWSLAYFSSKFQNHGCHFNYSF